MKKPITLISSICSLLFLIAIAWLGTGVYLDKKNGTQKADSRYEAFLSKCRVNFSENSYGSQEFSNEFIRSIGNIDDFSSLKLEVNGEMVYSYPPSYFSLPSPELVKSYHDTISVNGSSYTIKASIYLMSPNSVYNHSRLAFIIILVGTIIVGLFIVLTNGAENDIPEKYPYKARQKTFTSQKKSSLSEILPKKMAEEHERESDEERVSEETEPLSEEKTIVSHSEDEQKPIFNPPEETFDEAPEESDGQFSEENNKKEEEQKVEIPEELVFTEEDEQEWSDSELFEKNEPKEGSELDIIDQLEQANQQSLEEEAEEEEELSPITNIHYQASLEQKLDEAIVSELHVTLALLKINGLDHGNSISQNVIKILSDSLEGSELFEYKSDAYAAVLKGKDLQTSVDKFEGIYNEIADFLKDNNAANEVSVGISSADERDVKAERVILEANQALEYASQDPDSPIVAFRANPQKYKEFQERQGEN